MLAQAPLPANLQPLPAGDSRASGLSHTVEGTQIQQFLELFLGLEAACCRCRAEKSTGFKLAQLARPEHSRFGSSPGVGGRAVRAASSGRRCQRADLVSDQMTVQLPSEQHNDQCISPCTAQSELHELIQAHKSDLTSVGKVRGLSSAHFWYQCWARRFQT